MKRLVLTEPQYATIRSVVDTDPSLEACVFLHGVRYEAGDGIRYLVRHAVVPPREAYVERTAVSVALKSAYVGSMVQEARGENAFVAFVHSHPHISRPTFSTADDVGERLLAPFLKSRLGSSHHVSVIVGSDRWIAREIGQDDPSEVEIVSVGAVIRHLSESLDLSVDHELHDRQIRAFGPIGQRALKGLRVAIVGVGGTGSVVAQQLAHLGIGRLRLVDFDSIERSNLNRLVGATPEDVGTPKVNAVARHVRSIAPSCDVTAEKADVLSHKVAISLLREDFVFGCTDSHGSRAVLNQLAYQYFLPCVDVGVGIHVKNGQLQRIVGRAQMLAPGLGCLTCGNLLDAGQVRIDFMTPSERRADPYFVGAVVEQPAVISINATVASLGVSMAVSAVTGAPMHARLALYDGVQGVVRSATVDPVPRCVVCSEMGALGRGPTWELPSRSAGH
nr:ThiF family adenylyltransferase [Luteitalea sp.]